MIVKCQKAYFTVQISSYRESTLSGTGLKEFSETIEAFVSIYNCVSQLQHPVAVSPILDIECITMNSPAFLRLIGIEGVIKAIKELLALPQEWKKRRLEIEEQKAKLQTRQLEVQGQMEKNQRDYDKGERQLTILDKQIIQEEIKIKQLSVDVFMGTLNRISELQLNHPSTAHQFQPVLYKLAEDVSQLAISSLQVSVDEIEIIDGEFYDVEVKQPVLHEINTEQGSSE